MKHEGPTVLDPDVFLKEHGAMRCCYTAPAVEAHLAVAPVQLVPHKCHVAVQLAHGLRFEIQGTFMSLLFLC